MSIIVKSGSSGNLLNVNADGTLPVSIENTPSVAALDKMVTGVISNPDIVVPAPGGVGQMVSGTSTTGSFLAIPTTGLSSWSLSVTGGTFSTTFYFEGSIDTTNGLDGNWVSLFGRLLGNSGNENSQSFTIGNQMFEGTCGPLQFMRLRSVGGTITDPPTVILQAGAVSTISIGTPLPTGNNIIGHVVVDSGSLSAVVVTQSIGSNLHVDVDNFPATQPVSGTVAVSNFPATQPVSLAVAPTTPVTGTFFQSTQPVSAVTLPLPTGAAQDGTDNTGVSQPSSGVGIRGWLSAIYKALTGSIAVTGTFFQATQPVSLAVAPTTPVTGTFFQSTQPVSLATAPTTPVTGTFFQATQPVSAANLPLPTGAATSALQQTMGTAGAPSTQVASVQGVTGGLALPISAATLPLPTGAATSANQTTPVAKGTQGTTAEPTQDLKDSGRSKVILSSVKVTSITTEALLTLTQKKGDATVTTGTSYTVTAGKTLRIQSIRMYAEMTTAATAAWVSCRLREGAASGGAVSATSDIVDIVESSTIAVTDVIGMGVPPTIVNFPDGLEIAGGQTLGISELALNVDLSVTVIVVGFEY